MMLKFNISKEVSVNDRLPDEKVAGPAVPISGGVGDCVLMFSGGRDSTLAAIKLHEKGIRPVLVTVTSDHLMGYDAVTARLKELKRILPSDLLQIHLSQPKNLQVDQKFYFRTCLPCQHAYVVVAAAIAKRFTIAKIALGYSKYQGAWPEQTPLATTALDRVAAAHGLQLLLPAYEFGNKDEVKAMLTSYGLSDAALEQKCSRQVHNIELDAQHLKQQIEGWERAIDTSLSQIDKIVLEVRSEKRLGEF